MCRKPLETAKVARFSTANYTELTALPDLSGYLKMPGDEVLKIKIEYQAMDEMNPAFLGRL